MTRNVPEYGTWRLFHNGAGMMKRYTDPEFLVFRGEAATLGEAVVYRGTPVGILLDRLDEFPEECDAPPEVVAEAVRQLRERNPNGTETNW